MSLPAPQAKRRRNQSHHSAQPDWLHSSLEVMQLYGISRNTLTFGGAR
ncbi:hypothetical protein ACVIVC_003155 [Sinorhizobium meliloti]